MYIFIDDSGDGGFKIEKGSSRFIVMAACIFEDDEALTALDDAITRARTAIGRQDREFKYNKSSERHKEIYFNEIKDINFHIRVIYAEKAYIYSTTLRQSPEALKSYLIKMLLTHHYGNLHDAEVFIDGQDKRAFGIPGDKYIQYSDPDAIKSVQFIDSKLSNGVQLADMVAGAVHRCLKNSDRVNACNNWSSLRRKACQPKGTFWDFCSREKRN